MDALRARHKCPITCEVMHAPVMDSCGHNFERTAVEAWITSGHTTCPVGREPIALQYLFPNRALQEEIEEILGGPAPLPPAMDIPAPPPPRAAPAAGVEVLRRFPARARSVPRSTGGVDGADAGQRPAPSRGVHKVSTADQRNEMLSHIHQCSAAGCRTLWHGRWGAFIGGAQGATHFDLTDCPVGRQLNERIGWRYDIDDPAY